MEYVVSDMNTWSTHLIKYVRAKWMIYNKDATDDDDNSFEKGWDELMIKYFGILKESELYNAMINVCDKHFTEKDGNLVRDYFIKIAMKNPIIELIQDPSLLPFEMKQTNFTPGKGNALQICISVLFDIRNYDKIVPNFIEDPKGYAFGITQFLNTINYEMKKISLI
jgi:hypothetical protein